ncbi:MAG: hypothetical protein P8188_04460 [Gemmatimonadota bacterium]
MSAHDAYLRRTPYERLLPDPDFATRHFPGIRKEFRQHPVAEDDPGAFALLETTRRALAELRDPDQGGHDHGTTHALLLFHAFHLHAAGLPHLLATVPVSRWAVEAEGVETGETSEASPETTVERGLSSASYVQLPQHLFWSRDDDEDRPLSLDGFFWTVRGDVLHVLGVGGLQGVAGQGFQVLPLPGVPRTDADVWLSQEMRDEGHDFRSEMPGAELEGLYELRTAGELLKLAARIDRFMGRFPDGVEAVTSRAPGASSGAGDGPPGPSVQGPPRSHLDYARLLLT